MEDMYKSNGQAIIITAYKDFYGLQRLISILKPYFDIFVHVDKKSRELCSKMELLNDEHVHCYSKYRVYWGGVSHLKALLYLLEKARSGGYRYYHFISGEDFPVIEPSKLYRIFLNENRIFMRCIPLKHEIEKIQERFFCYSFFDFLNPRSKYRINRFLCIRLMDFMKKVLPKRNNFCGYGFEKVFYGLCWNSIPNDAVDFILDWVRTHQNQMKMLNTVAIPEEFFFQTILMNSSLSERIVGHDLRYYDWKERNGSSPAILDITDLMKVMKENYIFMRKISSPVSDSLTEAIINNW